MDVVFLAGLAVAFVLAHYSDKPPLVEKPIRLERNDRPMVAEQNLIGVRVIDTGLRNGVARAVISPLLVAQFSLCYSLVLRAQPGG